MNRRELMLLAAGMVTAAPPLRAQQKPMPVIGFLGLTSPGPVATSPAPAALSWSWRPSSSS